MKESIELPVAFKERDNEGLLKFEEEDNMIILSVNGKEKCRFDLEGNFDMVIERMNQIWKNKYDENSSQSTQNTKESKDD